MRRFEVWLDVQVAGKETYFEYLEFDDNVPQEEIDKQCAECLETMIANELDTGWGELVTNNLVTNDEEEAQ